MVDHSTVVDYSDRLQQPPPPPSTNSSKEQELNDIYSKRKTRGVIYTVDENPPWYLTLIFALQVR